MDSTNRNPDLQQQRVQTWWVPNADHNDVEHKTGVRCFAYCFWLASCLPFAEPGFLLVRCGLAFEATEAEIPTQRYA